MIEVIIKHKESGAELGRIEVENVTEDGQAEFANYSVRFGVERIKGVGIHQRGMMNFPRKKYNVLGLLYQALATLSPEEMELEGEFYERPLKSIMGNIFRRG